MVASYLLRDLTTADSGGMILRDFIRRPYSVQEMV